MNRNSILTLLVSAIVGLVLLAFGLTLSGLTVFLSGAIHALTLFLIRAVGEVRVKATSNEFKIHTLRQEVETLTSREAKLEARVRKLEAGR